MKPRIAAAVLLASACFAQTPAEPPKPPAEVDQALRARVNDFYGMVLRKEFRKAESMIADDTRDYYYAISKPDITKFELLEIKYSGDFTHATAFVQCSQKVQQPGFPMGEWVLKVPSLWKIENGEWRWYVVQTQVMSPIGIIKDSTPIQAGVAPPAAAGGIPKEFATTTAFALGKVTVEQKSVTLELGKPEKVTIVNNSAGAVAFTMPKQLGLDIKLEPDTLGAGEKATLTLRAVKGSNSGTLGISVVPTNEVLSIQVTVK
jgi:hypothetical protein